MPDDFDRVLAVVAHPDDIEFGAAAAIAKWTAEGKTAGYVVLTRGEAGIDGLPPAEAAPVREAEQRASAAVVGVRTVRFLDHRDGAIEYGLPLRRDIAAMIRAHRPELVVGFCHRDRSFTGRWNSPDHRNTGRAVLDAIGDAGNRWIFPDLPGEPWNDVRYVAMANSPEPTHAVDVTSSVDKAEASLREHRTYLDSLGVTEVRGPLLGMLNAIGQRFGGVPSVGFELVPR